MRCLYISKNTSVKESHGTLRRRLRRRWRSHLHICAETCHLDWSEACTWSVTNREQVRRSLKLKPHLNFCRHPPIAPFLPTHLGNGRPARAHLCSDLVCDFTQGAVLESPCGRKGQQISLALQATSQRWRRGMVAFRD